MEIVRFNAALGAEVVGVDLSAPIDDEDFRRVREAWLEHCLLLFRHVSISAEQQISFTRRFGALHVMGPPEFNLPEHPEIFVVSNAYRDGRPVGMRRVGLGWHTDGEDKRIPNAGSFLYALEIPPEGGDTHFVNMYSAYDALPDRLKRRIQGRCARYSRVRLHAVHYPDLPPLSETEKAARPDVFHPLVRTHPESGRRALYIGRWACEVEGLDAREGRALIEKLQAFSTQERFAYHHRWKRHDALLWDNRCTQHRATPFDEQRYVRHMHRTTLEGDLPR